MPCDWGLRIEDWGLRIADWGLMRIADCGMWIRRYHSQITPPPPVLSHFSWKTRGGGGYLEDIFLWEISLLINFPALRAGEKKGGGGFWSDADWGLIEECGLRIEDCKTPNFFEKNIKFQFPPLNKLFFIVFFFNEKKKRWLKVREISGYQHFFVPKKCQFPIYQFF